MSSSNLVAAGWKRTASGRWWHPSFPGVNGRRRLFTTEAAASLLDADPGRLPLVAFQSSTEEDPED